MPGSNLTFRGSWKTLLAGLLAVVLHLPVQAQSVADQHATLPDLQGMPCTPGLPAASLNCPESALAQFELELVVPEVYTVGVCPQSRSTLSLGLDSPAAGETFQPASSGTPGSAASPTLCLSTNGAMLLGVRLQPADMPPETALTVELGEGKTERDNLGFTGGDWHPLSGWTTLGKGHTFLARLCRTALRDLPATLQFDATLGYDPRNSAPLTREIEWFVMSDPGFSGCQGGDHAGR